MPIPKPNKDESKKNFITRCMGNPTMNKEYPDPGQRYAICNNSSKGSLLEEVLKILSVNIIVDVPNKIIVIVKMMMMMMIMIMMMMIVKKN